jgi:thioredoxin:protein disulfide reductase
MYTRIGIFLLLLCSAGLERAAANNFLPAAEAFRYFVIREGQALTVHWQIAPGYYLYKQRMSIESGTAGITLGTPQWPAGESYQDEFFGEQEVFRETFSVSVPFESVAAQATHTEIQLHWQGCAEAGFCYPPTVWTVRVDLATDLP